MAGRSLVVMEGGHPWGFRIEGGAEVREPIRINKVLEGGKAFNHRIQVGDALISINGESASNMTISRARHLIRTSDNLLILEVVRPFRSKPQIPEIRVISPSDHLANGTNLSWGANGALESRQNLSQSNFSNRAVDPRYSTQVIRSSRPSTAGSRPVPPPKPPLAMRSAVNTQRRDDIHKSTRYAGPISPSSPVVPLHIKDPGVMTPPGSSSASQSQPVMWQNRRTPNIRPQTPRKPDNLKSFVPVESTRLKSASQVRNTEPAPIRPGGYGTYQYADNMGDYDDQQSWLKKVDPMDVKQFRYGSTDAGPRNIDQSGDAPVFLPLSPIRKPSVSEDQLQMVDLFIKEDPYDFIPPQQGKVLHVRGEVKPMIHHQNQYNTGKSQVLRARTPLEKTWPRKFEMPEAGFDSLSTPTRVEPNVYPDYEYLPSRSSHQGNRILSPTEEVVNRSPITKREHIIYPGPSFQRVSTRQKLDEESLRRKLEIERVIAEERQRRLLKDQMANSARRHSDNFSPTQRRSLLMDRFSDDEVAEALARPARRTYTKIRGKARALYTFRAQNSRELSFKRNDIVYILRQIDKNWYEGERHGLVGIFPVTYVEVITSLDEAKATAILREGTATAIYNFRAQTEIELPLRKGDLVSLIRRVDDNWYEGRIGRRQGIFPINYVETHREPDTPMVTPMSSLAPTPVPGTPICQSPVSSLYSTGPEIPSAPMSPLDSEFYESDWDADSLGPLQSGCPLSSSRPTSPAYSDREITPVRAVTSPIPSGTAIRTVISPPPDSPLMRPVASSVQSGPSPRSIISPVPNSSMVKGVVSPASSGGAPIRTVLSPVPKDAPNRSVISPPPYGASSRILSSPVSHSAGDPRISVDGCKVQKPAVPPKSFTLPSSQNPKKEVRIEVVANSKESNKPLGNIDQNVQTKGAAVANDAAPMKTDPTKQRPPSGRPGTLTLKSNKQRSPGAKQASTETRGGQRDAFSKSLRSQNPYMRYRAVYNYKPQNIDELELNRGDIIFVMEKCADGWYVGISDRTKQFGTFPGNFVRPM